MGNKSERRIEMRGYSNANDKKRFIRKKVEKIIEGGETAEGIRP